MEKKLLTIQDISCFGQCSLTVALPVISACGTETVILPSAVLSTHTAGFTGYTFRDLTCDITPIAEHWKREKIDFLFVTPQINVLNSVVPAEVPEAILSDHCPNWIEMEF